MTIKLYFSCVIMKSLTFIEYSDDKKTRMFSDLLPEFFIISRRRRWYWTKHCLKFLKQEFNHLVRRYPL